MTKQTLKDFLDNNLSTQELREWAAQIENKLKNEDTVELLFVASGILVIKYFPIDKEDEAIKCAFKYLNKTLKDRKGVGNLWGAVEIDTTSVPSSEVHNYLEMNNE